jgi:NTP pyrophosphatase (non-canonical NTP hydrolase)
MDSIEDITDVANECLQFREYFKGKRDTMCPTLAGVVANYYHFRGYEFPDTEAAFKWLLSEIGELSEALVQENHEWIRNNPNDRKVDVEAEIGDILMMLTALAISRNTDPLTCMIEKMQTKLFNPEIEYRLR